MPLLDHFRPPLSLRHPWQSIHSAWANAMVRQLNEGILPDRYYALPNVQPAGRLEIDVAALERSGPPGGGDESAVATAVWAPPLPALRIAVDADPGDVFEVQVLNVEEGRLVAAIELVSPANKDRPASRRALAVKAASLLWQGVAVSLVDVVGRRGGDFLREVCELLGATIDRAPAPTELTAHTFRLNRQDGGERLDIWPETLTIGLDLPTLPVWLSAELVVPLDLESSYESMCSALRLGV